MFFVLILERKERGEIEIAMRHVRREYGASQTLKERHTQRNCIQGFKRCSKNGTRSLSEH